MDQAVKCVSSCLRGTLNADSQPLPSRYHITLSRNTVLLPNALTLTLRFFSPRQDRRKLFMDSPDDAGGLVGEGHGGYL